MSIYDYEVTTLRGEPITLDRYRGKVLLIVNTASKCGFTPQFAGLEHLYKKYGPEEFVVLGFPCNQFAGQEPGTENEIGEFCQRNYGVTFPMFSKIDVNGKDTHPLYEHLKRNSPGFMGIEAIKWNFTKFLLDREGLVVKRFAPADPPEKLTGDIESLL